jgi:hypothetical protein
VWVTVKTGDSAYPEKDKQRKHIKRERLTENEIG